MSKEDLWDAIKEYPEAKSILIEKGRQLLRKDNLLDEEIAKKQDMEQMTTEEKLDTVEGSLDTLQTRFARLLAEFNTVQLKLKQRITKLEKQLRKDGADTVSLDAAKPDDADADAADAGEDGAAEPTERTSQSQMRGASAGSNKNALQAPSHSSLRAGSICSIDSFAEVLSGRESKASGPKPPDS